MTFQLPNSKIEKKNEKLLQLTINFYLHLQCLKCSTDSLKLAIVVSISVRPWRTLQISNDHRSTLDENSDESGQSLKFQKNKKEYRCTFLFKTRHYQNQPNRRLPSDECPSEIPF